MHGLQAVYNEYPRNELGKEGAKSKSYSQIFFLTDTGILTVQTLSFFNFFIFPERGSSSHDYLNVPSV
jgi:hypothetical protein